MIQYVKFSVTCTSRKKEERQLYSNFKSKLKKYLIDEVMELYKVPILSEEYNYANELSEKYSWDYNREDDIDDFPGFYINKRESVDTEYSKKDYDMAEAYMVNFWYLVYSYDLLYEGYETEKYIKKCCNNSSWKYEDIYIPYKSYRIPASEMRNKKYANMGDGFIFSKEAVELLVNEKLAEFDDFWEVKDKKGKVVGYQIYPQNEIFGFANDNNSFLIDECQNCGLQGHKLLDEPFYISESTLKQLKGLNRTREVFGEMPEILGDESTGECDEFDEDLIIRYDPYYIVNKEVFNVFTKAYPRSKKQFIPIFKKEM